MGINQPPDIVKDYYVFKTKKTDSRPEWKHLPFTPFSLEEKLELFKRDGFKSAKEMFNWFDKHYDLKQPRRFWVYGWNRLS